MTSFTLLLEVLVAGWMPLLPPPVVREHFVQAHGGAPAEEFGGQRVERVDVNEAPIDTIAEVS